MAYPIKAGVPVPPANKQGAQLKYPFDRMKVGDSFAYVGTVSIPSFRRAAARYGDRHNMRFVVRKAADGQWRCWRTK